MVTYLDLLGLLKIMSNFAIWRYKSNKIINVLLSFSIISQLHIVSGWDTTKQWLANKMNWRVSKLIKEPLRLHYGGKWFWVRHSDLAKPNRAPRFSQYLKGGGGTYLLGQNVEKNSIYSIYLNFLINTNQKKLNTLHAF